MTHFGHFSDPPDMLHIFLVLFETFILCTAVLILVIKCLLKPNITLKYAFFIPSIKICVLKRQKKTLRNNLSIPECHIFLNGPAFHLKLYIVSVYYVNINTYFNQKILKGVIFVWPRKLFFESKLRNFPSNIISSYTYIF